jgi:hypothetical protein
MLQAHVGPGRFISGFGVCLFLALVFLLKWQRRRQAKAAERMRRGLQGYVSSNREQLDAESDAIPVQR